MYPTTIEHDQATTAAIPPKRRRRRSTLVWALFAVAGLAMGAVWATGFADSNATNGTNAAAHDVFGSANGANSQSPYQSKITSPEALTIDFDGLWGLVPSDATLFKVDLTGYTGQTFYTDIYLVNPNDEPAGWSAQQYKFLRFTDPATCNAATNLTALTADEALTMNVTTNDSYVSFDGLAGDHVYCYGVVAINPASDNNGTFLRRPDTGTVPTMPEFTAAVNRSA